MVFVEYSNCNEDANIWMTTYKKLSQVIQSNIILTKSRTHEAFHEDSS